MTDTVAAQATPPGPGGIAVLRVSGPQALAVADRLFTGQQRPSRRPGYTLLHGHIVEPGFRRPVDEVLLSVFRAPRSYTGENMIEISCHGGTAAARAVLGLLLRHGCRPARPGEFTRRAVLNGRLDLAQAEAVLELTRARTDAARRTALRQLDGVFSNRVAELARALERAEDRLYAALELAEDMPVGVPARVRADLRLVQSRLRDLARQAESGPRLRSGALAVIVGRPNVGKSSLFNRLILEERAIVTATPGTTRDSLEARLDLPGVELTLVDTAGWRTRAGRIEALGMARTERCVERADVLLVVLDASTPLTRQDLDVIATVQGRRRILVLNKIDRARTGAAAVPDRNGTARVLVSARTGAGLPALRRALARLFTRPGPEPDFIAVPRHQEALNQAGAALDRALAAPALDIRLAETRTARQALEEILGRRSSEQVLDQVFREFCVGK